MLSMQSLGLPRHDRTQDIDGGDMTRPTFPRLKFCRRTVGCAFILAVLAAIGSASAADRPNILLIVSEDNGPELGCYGDPYVRTPVLDRLAEEGVRFHNAYVPQAGCSQSRAALLTGLFPHQNGQIGLATWKFRMYREDTPNIVRSLKDAGYRSGIIGKLHINPASAFPFDAHHIPKSNFGRKQISKYAEHAAEFFDSGDGPFFLSVNYPDAHRPFIKQIDGLPSNPLTGSDVKPLAYFGLDSPELRDDTANYYNCMSRLDSLIGDLLKALEESARRTTHWLSTSAITVRTYCEASGLPTKAEFAFRSSFGGRETLKRETCAGNWCLRSISCQHC